MGPPGHGHVSRKGDAPPTIENAHSTCSLRSQSRGCVFSESWRTCRTSRGMPSLGRSTTLSLTCGMSAACLRIRSAVGGGRLKASRSTSPRAKPRLHRSPSAISTSFSNRKVGRTGVAYPSRRVQRRCARSSGMPRGRRGAPPESQRPSTRRACSNRKGSPEVLSGPTSSASWTAPADANCATYATTRF